MMIKDTKDHDDHEMMLIQVPMMLMTVETSLWMTMLIMMQGNSMFLARFIERRKLKMKNANSHKNSFFTYKFPS